MTGIIEGEHLKACLSQNSKEDCQAAGETGVMEILNVTHNIIFVGQQAVPEHLKGRTLIVYLPEQDAIVIAGWEENTAVIAELITDYLEFTPDQRENTLEAPYYIGSSGKELEIWRVLDGIWQIRHSKRE